MSVWLVAANSDPYQWLEDIDGERAVAWVKQQNARTIDLLTKTPRFGELRKRFLSILDSKQQIPGVNQRGALLYNFWKDEAHPRGLWRRTTMAEYKKLDPKWETVLDVDALAQTEKENWTWSKPSCLPRHPRCVIMLSRGGADAVVAREFDLDKKAFVRDGFNLPEGKTEIEWRDLDHVFVAADFGPGSLTDSGYARIVKLWQRGTPVIQAKVLFEGAKTDVAVGAWHAFGPGRGVDLVERRISTYLSEHYLFEGGKTAPIGVPKDCEIEVWDDQLLVSLRSPWATAGKTWPAGAYLAAPLVDVMRGTAQWTPLFEPSARRALASVAKLKTGLLVNAIEDVRGFVTAWTRHGKSWRTQPIHPLGRGTAIAVPLEENERDEYLLHTADFTAPNALSLGALDKPIERLKQAPSFFDASALVVEQHFVKSKDGTSVPYFQVARRDLQLNGDNPTLLYGYGGFETTLEPEYAPMAGAGWMEAGGVYVVANIRGGGEYGPQWHQAALKENRQRAYDDFIAIAEDLIQRKVTAPRRLGIQGGSNGGLLVGVMLVQRPDLFGAVLCQSPLLDMHRYTKLFAGASWMGEYGDPEVPSEWAWLAKYSPYQNFKPTVTYPRTLFTTSHSDDRVHPGHARKMAALMGETNKDVWFYESMEGGHTGLTINDHVAFDEALSYTFLAEQLRLQTR